MKKEENQHCPFQQNWNVVASECKINQNWVPAPSASGNPLVWKFLKCERFLFPAGHVAFYGKLIEYENDLELTRTDYLYFPDRNVFSLEHFEFKANGLLKYCLAERYRIKFTDDENCILYELYGVENEPEDYSYRIRLQRIKNEE